MYTRKTVSQPPGSAQVDNSYAPNSNGNWWLMDNWVDNGPPNAKINFGDTFNFTLVDGTQIWLADPTIFRLTSGHGTWFYIAGTDDSQEFTNHTIYRTRDFTQFYVHMMLFDNFNMTGSNQWRDGYIRHINGTWFTLSWGPHLYLDPTEMPGPNRLIHMSMMAVWNDDDANGHTLFYASIREADFIAWHDKDPWQDDGIRFADARAGFNFQPTWYFYTETNSPNPPYRFDGGYMLSKYIPCTGTEMFLGPACGQLEQRLRGMSYRCHGAAPRMIGDPFIFFDPNRSAGDPWKRVMLYVWMDAHNLVPFDNWGNHIAAHPMLFNYQLNSNHGTMPLAMDRNNGNTINGLDNGAVDAAIQQWPWGGIAEGMTAFFHPVTNRYYLIYSRNTWDSSAYQLVYRMTEPGQPFWSLQLSQWMDQDVTEHVLLRAWDYAVPVSQGGGANFGHGEVFTIRDGAGVEWFYLMVHCKLDYMTTPGVWTGARTVFFKELTVENVQTGKLVELKESSPNKARDMRCFRIPRCRQP